MNEAPVCLHLHATDIWMRSDKPSDCPVQSADDSMAGLEPVCLLGSVSMENAPGGLAVTETTLRTNLEAAFNLLLLGFPAGLSFIEVPCSIPCEVKRVSDVCIRLCGLCRASCVLTDSLFVFVFLPYSV